MTDYVKVFRSVSSATSAAVHFFWCFFTAYFFLVATCLFCLFLRAWRRCFFLCVERRLRWTRLINDVFGTGVAPAANVTGAVAGAGSGAGGSSTSCPASGAGHGSSSGW